MLDLRPTTRRIPETIIGRVRMFMSDGQDSLCYINPLSPLTIIPYMTPM